MEKYIKEADLKKYLDKQYKLAVQLKDKANYNGNECQEEIDYYDAQIEQLKEICDDLELGVLGI